MLVTVDDGWGRRNNEHIFITYASARWVTRTAAAAAEPTAAVDTPELREYGVVVVTKIIIVIVIYYYYSDTHF